ncbi:hypothetical protein [Dolichospermum compactum]|uniref:Uncharacterized protein n=1 Tax=Dolichospermum compactum NIES-806 TaxID=1973481 RepID=A0A1Z4V6K9_9CYAN|nr:hypothetical protein [Dolichospermum compactum]BAZ87196.1 hypothetical protein NIES806_34170 [Dolichospermum compactum NIES-806]
MTNIPDNIRLKELAIIANSNKLFFDDFINFIQSESYRNLHEFVTEKDSSKAQQVLLKYLQRKVANDLNLYDGIARPYPQSKAKWLFLGWIFRDAPIQRLQNILKNIDGTANERKATLLNHVREYVSAILPEPERWEWFPICEVIMERLEGSRRAIKGNLFEAIIRTNLQEIFKTNKIKLVIGETQIKLGGETYDVTIMGEKGTILIPVKTRETTGGGHALLFTRDINQAIEKARNDGYKCIPIIIAEAWKIDFDSLKSPEFIHIDKNPNQIIEVEQLLNYKLKEILHIFQSIE